MSQFVFPPLTANLDSEAANGGSLPSKQLIIGGYDGANVRAIKVDSSGELQVDVGSITPGTGATDLGKAIQSAQGTTDTGVAALVVRNDTLADLSGADGDYTPLQVNATGALYTAIHSSALPTGAATEAKQDVIETTLNSIEGDTSSLAGAVSGTEMQVDIVASLPAGTNNIGDVDIASALPAGTNSIGTVILGAGTAAIGKLSANSGVDIGDVDVTSLPALPAGTNTIGKVDVNAIAPVDFLDSGLVDTSTANIASTGTTVVSSLAAACTEIEIQEDIGEFMSLRVGGTVKAFLPLGGGRVKVSLAATDAVQLFSETGTAISSGKIAINFLG